MTATATARATVRSTAAMTTRRTIAADHDDNDSNKDGDGRHQYECGPGGERRENDGPSANVIVRLILVANVIIAWPN